jgi:hypothetical protein
MPVTAFCRCAHFGANRLSKGCASALELWQTCGNGRPLRATDVNRTWSRSAVELLTGLELAKAAKAMPGDGRVNSRVER